MSTTQEVFSRPQIHPLSGSAVIIRILDEVAQEQQNYERQERSQAKAVVQQLPPTPVPTRTQALKPLYRYD